MTLTTADTKLLELLPQKSNGVVSMDVEKTESASKNVKIFKYSTLTDQELLSLYRSSQDKIGLPLGHRTRYFIIDIDAKTSYHNPEDIKRLVELFEQRQIKLHVCQSSPSGSIHLLCIFTRRVSTQRVINLYHPICNITSLTYSPEGWKYFHLPARKISPFVSPSRTSKVTTCLTRIKIWP